MSAVLLLVACQALSTDSVVSKGIDEAVEHSLQRAEELREELKAVNRGLVREIKRDRSRIELERLRADARKRANKKPLGEKRRVFETRKEKSERLAELKRLLAETQTMPAFPLTRGEPSAGHCGKLARDAFRVSKIIGPQEVLGTIRWHHGKKMTIDGLIEYVPITTVFAKPYEVCLQGVDTSKMKAGQTCEVVEPIILLAKPKQIQTATGISRTVSTGRALSEAEIKQINERLAPEER